MTFDNAHCFLSGEALSAQQQVNVFPKWLTDSYNLSDVPFKMLDESMVTYAAITLPCSDAVRQKLDDLENTIQTAFEAGYQSVKNLNPDLLFLWVAKTVYGVIFKEIQVAIRQQHTYAEGFNMSQGLIHKFSMLHTMLQQLNHELVFENFKPYSLFLCPVKNAENEFAYRDEINTLSFSLRIKDFGLLLCLQDNGANKVYHQDLWAKIEGKTLHPIQFEELCAKVFYSAYLFNRLPEYQVITTDDAIYLETMPLRGMSAKPIFDDWQFKTYGQVAENFWKRWGFLLLEIIKNPDKPMSFLLDDDGKFKPAESIDLPLAWALV